MATTNWQTKKLGEVLEYEQPSLYIVNSKNYKDDYETPVLTAGKSFILGKTKEKNGIFPKDKLPVIIFDDFTTATKFVDFPFKVKSSAMKILHPVKNISDAKFLFYLIQNICFDYTGIHKRYWISEYSKIQILLPPLPEQHRIVKILDEVFENIGKAKENTEKNLQNTKELFESYLQGVFANPGNDWVKRSIQEVSKVINGYAFASKDFKSTNTIKSIKITNVGVREFIEETDNYLPEKFKKILRDVQVNEGNILVALTRTIISAGLKVAVVPKSYDGALVNQRVAALVPNENIINQRYLYNFLTSKGVEKYVLAHVNTLMQPNLSINDLKKLSVPCPPLEAQKSIVAKLDALSAETKKLEAIYKQKLADLEELKKSILKKAFAGEL